MHMSKELPPSRKADQFVARFPDGLRDRLAAVAKESGRSMNAEIVARLQASFETPSTERIKDLELALFKEREAAAAARANAFQYSTALMLIAGRLPSGAFADTPAIAAILKEATVNKNAKIIAALHQMVADTVQSIADIDHHVTSAKTKTGVNLDNSKD